MVLSRVYHSSQLAAPAPAPAAARLLIATHSTLGPDCRVSPYYQQPTSQPQALAPPSLPPTGPATRGTRVQMEVQKLSALK